MTESIGGRSLTLVRDSDGVGVLTLDVPGESANTLREEFAPELQRVLLEASRDDSLRALVIASGKRDSFIVGADISMLDRVPTVDDATRLSRVAQAALDVLAGFPIPVIAAIHGPCLGGGLELALACSGRIASSSEKTKLGLPEVQLGLLPGMGGTQRLPRLVGLPASLDLLLTGKQLDARRALRMGLVDEVVAPELLLALAKRHALKASEAHSRTQLPSLRQRPLLSREGLLEFVLAENPLGRKLVFDRALAKVLTKTWGNFPAPERILDVVKLGLSRGMKRGQEAEAEAFGQLVESKQSKALRHIYFAQQNLKKRAQIAEGSARPAERIAIVGAGLMGVGVAQVTLLQAKASVRLQDVSDGALQSGMRALGRELDEQVVKKRLTHREREELWGKVTCTTAAELLGGVDVVIEAVFEDIELKRKVLLDVEDHCTRETIFASNTSSLPIALVAEGCRHPERVVGMHYFSPVPKMPLLEVITTAQTADWVVATCVALGRRQGKTVIVVSDGPGFFTTRILGPYLNEAAHALLEGYSVDHIDAALVKAGYPVGPLALLDEVGIDVGAKVGHTLEAAFGERMRVPPSLGLLLDAGRRGRKNQKGFYSYRDQVRGARPVDERVYVDLGLAVPNKQKRRAETSNTASDIAERCLLSMVNESAHCLGEGIVKSAYDADIGAIFGLGFPPHLGGPLFYVDQEGAKEVVARLERLQRTHGNRFAPAKLLVAHASSGDKFYP